MDSEDSEDLDEEIKYPRSNGWEETIPATSQNFYELREELVATIKDSNQYGGMNYRRSLACNRRMLKLLNSIIESKTTGEKNTE